MNLIMLGYLATGLLGAVANWALKWSSGDTFDSLWDYIKSNKKYTVRSGIGVSMLVSAAILTGEPDMVRIVTLFMSCVGADAMLNKSSEFHPEKKTVPIRIDKDKCPDPKRAREILEELATMVSYEDLQGISGDTTFK